MKNTLCISPWCQHGHLDKSKKINFKKSKTFFLLLWVPEGHIDLKNVHALEVPESGTVKIIEVKKQESGCISGICPQIKKRIELFFFNFKKLEKIKNLYFFDKRQNG